MNEPDILKIIATSVVCIASILMFYSLYSTFKIIKRLKANKYRIRWVFLLCLITFFAIAHLFFARNIYINGVSNIALLVSMVFLFSAIFVFLVCDLMQSTVDDFNNVHSFKRDSITDSLTGVFNRRYFDQRVQEEFEKARRYKTEFSMILVDVDNFKEVNDSFGRRVGDKCLIGVTELMSGVTRPSDILARYNGEELAMILPNTDIDNARQVAEKLRSLIAGDKLEMNDTGQFSSILLDVTISIGLVAILAKF